MQCVCGGENPMLLFMHMDQSWVTTKLKHFVFLCSINLALHPELCIQIHSAVCSSCWYLQHSIPVCSAMYVHITFRNCGDDKKLFSKFSFNFGCFHPPGSAESLSQHTAFLDSLEPSPWAVPPADKPGGSGGVVLNEVRLSLSLLLISAMPISWFSFK